MPTDFERYNNEYQLLNPSPAYTDTGTTEPTSIQRYNNNEDADEDVFRRPVEQNRRRTDHLGQELNHLAHNHKATQGAFVDTRSTLLKWYGLSAASSANIGVFELTGSLFIKHPMYPATTFELAAAVVGNSGAGWFNTEANRLKEEGDSLWITFGADTQDSFERDIVARTPSATPVGITQAQLRKGPTWVLLQDTANDLSSLGIVPGSDIVRVYPDPSGNPGVFLERTIRDIHQDEDGFWYLEVSPDTPFYQSTAGVEIPSILSNNKLIRTSNSAEYEILDSGAVTTRLAQTAFANYVSNLHWSKAGRKRPMKPNGTTTEYRENEWQHAIPLCVVSDGKLFWPLAAAGGISPNGNFDQSLNGFVRTSQSDVIYAQHIWSALQSLVQSPGLPLISLDTNSDALGVGRGSHEYRIEEANVDGVTSSPQFWVSPGRPGRSSVSGSSDAKAAPIYRLSEQGFYTAGGAEQYKENTLELRMPGTPGQPTNQGSRYAELRASQMLYTSKASNNNHYIRNVAFDLTTANIPGLAAGSGLQVGANIVLGEANLYETLLGQHDIEIKGTVSFDRLYPITIDETGGVPVGSFLNVNSTLTMDFSTLVRLTPDSANPLDPFSAAVLAGTSPKYLHERIESSYDPSTGDTLGAIPVIRQYTFDTTAIKPDSGGAAVQNTLYPSAATPGAVTLFEGLFSRDYYRYTGVSPTIVSTLFARHSEVFVRPVLYTEYNGGTGNHEVGFYLQFEFHTDDGDANETDRLNNHLFTENFKSINKALRDIVPKVKCDLSITHRPVWSE